MHFDELETQSPEARETRLMAALAAQLAHAKANSAAYARLLADIDPAAVTSREALARLPVVRKSELAALQQTARPFGGFNGTPLAALAKVFQSPGPLYEPEGRRPDYWRMARALFAAGLRPGELVHNTFSYHFTPAGSMMESGAAALGCPVFPAGVGQTELQVQAIADLRPVCYTGTPSFLKIILDKAAELGVDVSSLKKALVTGEALPGSLQQWFSERGIAVYQCYGTADLGLIAYESAAREGLIVDEGVIVEIVRPGTGDPVPAGEVGEVVVTTLNPDYPLIRFGTGDLSALLPGTSPCGRTNLRIRGWLGRADQTTKVRGMFVHPAQVAEVLRRHPEVRRGRLVVDSHEHQDEMTLHCELAGAAPAGLAKAIAASLREVCKLRGNVKFVSPGELPNDGKVIDDIRRYE
ncbi:MAG TPA: AMP-binding protein [Candidatus Competibacteraceae bacterium]|nr:AMP-binding protein [Candidatus Competibacteraceae bacterium]